MSTTISAAGHYRGPLGPFERLAGALRREPLDLLERTLLSRREGFGENTSRLLSAAKVGRPVNADAFLVIHHLRGWDPLTSKPADALMPPWRGNIVWAHLALALRHEAEVLDKGVRPCAARAGVSYATWHRASHGLPVCVDNLFRLCAHFDRHPHEVTALAVPAPVSRETTPVTPVTGASAPA